MSLPSETKRTALVRRRCKERNVPLSRRSGIFSFLDPLSQSGVFARLSKTKSLLFCFYIDYTSIFISHLTSESCRTIIRRARVAKKR